MFKSGSPEKQTVANIGLNMEEIDSCKRHSVREISRREKAVEGGGLGEADRPQDKSDPSEGQETLAQRGPPGMLCSLRKAQQTFREHSGHSPQRTFLTSGHLAPLQLWLSAILVPEEWCVSYPEWHPWSFLLPLVGGLWLHRG